MGSRARLAAPRRLPLQVTSSTTRAHAPSRWRPGGNAADGKPVLVALASGAGESDDAFTDLAARGPAPAAAPSPAAPNTPAGG